MTEFADRGLFDAETESARKGLPERAVSVVECVCSGADATPSPSRRGLKRHAVLGDQRVHDCRCNTVPIEKGTETCQAPATTACSMMQHRPHREGD